MRKLILLLLLIGLYGCGGGGGGDGGSPAPDLGTAPRITNVLFYDENDLNTPSEEFEIGDYMHLSVCMIDPDLNITTLCMCSYYPSESETPYIGPDCVIISSSRIAKTPVQLCCCMGPYTITGPTGLWRYEFQVEDSKGNESNVFIKYMNTKEPE